MNSTDQIRTISTASLRALFVFFFVLAIHKTNSQCSNQCDGNKEMRQFLDSGFVGQGLDDDLQQCSGDYDGPDGAKE